MQRDCVSIRAGIGECTSDIAGIFIDTAQDFARGFLRTALHLEWFAVEFARPVPQQIFINRSGREHLARRAGVNVALLVKPEVFAATYSAVRVPSVSLTIALASPRSTSNAVSVSFRWNRISKLC